MTVNVTLRTPKGSPLTTAEVDANFADLAAAINAVGSSYTLPVAAASTLGGVQVGSGLTVDGNGTMSLNLTSAAVTAALGYTPLSASTGVTTFNSRTGAVSLTSGDVTSALGFTPMSAAASGGPHGSQRYTTVGTHAFVVPAGVTTVFLTGAAGGGGAFQRMLSAPVNVRGGRGQVVYRKAVTVTPGETVAVVVGGGGDSYVGIDNLPASNGQPTSFGGYVTLAGGGGSRSDGGTWYVGGADQPPLDNLAFFMSSGLHPNTTFYGDPAVYTQGSVGYSPELVPPAQRGYLVVEW